MPPEHDNHSPEWIDRIESLINRAQEIADPSARSIAIELSQAIMQFHQAGIGRIVEILSESEPGEAILSRMAQDELARSILLVHDLHPEPMETRIERAVGMLDDAFGSLGARVSLAGFANGIVYINFDSSRAWPGPETRARIEKFLYEAAPEIEGVVIEGMREEPRRDFVALDEILAGSPQRRGTGVDVL